MRTYGQFCPIARASEVLAERWTPIILRNLLLGCNTFTEIAAGAPGLSRALLSKRLQELERAGVIEIGPKPDGHGSVYEPTQAGRDLWKVLQAMGGWAQKWMEVTPEHADPDAVLWSWCTTYFRRDRLPKGRILVRFEFPEDQPTHRRRLWLLVEDGEGEICHRDPGFAEDLVVTVEDPRTFARWHLGLVEWAEALRSDRIHVSGSRSLARALPTWNAGPQVYRTARQDTDRILPAHNPHLELETTRREVRAPDVLAAVSGTAKTAIPGFDGVVLTPADARYDQARLVWNGAIDRRPRYIAQCRTVDDVIVGVRFARAHDLPVAVRGGGHGVAGMAVCDDGMVIDLSPMKGIQVDPATRTVRAQGGVLWGEMDVATQAFGLATTGGMMSQTGIAGLTLGGGIGWLMRRHGLTSDNLIEAQVVTADGELIVANEEDHVELFWGLRGGGGNFGIVTSFTYRLHPVGPELLAGPVLWTLDDSPEVLRLYREFVAQAPREVNTVLTLRKAPPLSVLPAELHGRPVCMITMVYVGHPDVGKEALAALRRFGRPLLDLVRVRPYTDLQTLVDDTVPHGWHYYWKTADVGPLDNSLVDVLVEHTSRVRSPHSYTLIYQLGGAIADLDEDATAYSGRDADHTININGVWLPGQPTAADEIAWARGGFAALQPYQTGAYINFLDRDDQDRVPSSYGVSKYQRLVALKDRYDPDNVFHLNHNITPSEPVGALADPAEGRSASTA